ncbi:ALBINO3-like protein 2, chloroplastic [Humulus lupulus]|uniref:ALBINO3-like protein 2, chloroplastic n=1 Tax=Humulus lupulus TaxID=3486 RepID=UPI002B409A76|nr:ALBINO3-like protein 2, chloroplastic [Humulus lupulus]
MATYKILNRVRRSVPATYLSTLSHAHEYPLLTNPIPDSNSSNVISPLPFSSHHRRPNLLSRTPYSLVGAPDFLYSRTIFTRSGDDSEYRGAEDFDVDFITKLPESTVLDAASAIGNEESILPVRVVISMLDGFHDLTGLPWWIVIAFSTLSLRVVLFPILVLQLRKLNQIGPLGQSHLDPNSLSQEKRQAYKKPSFLWLLPYACVQIPCFLLWMTSIRKMSLNHHPGFDCGGAFWFHNLTEFSHGVLGSIFPFVIAGLHYANVQNSFKRSSVKETTGLLDVAVKYYKLGLDFMTLPILCICYCVPQGSQVYWASNLSLTFTQHFLLKHPAVRAKLGLPVEKYLNSADSSVTTPAITTTSEPKKPHQISLEALSPLELLNLSTQLLSKQHIERAIPIIQLALSKDPESTRGLILMGQTLMQKGLLPEAIEYMERAVSKLLLAGHLTGVADISDLIRASNWAGSLHIRQGNIKEGLIHLERIGRLKEPEDPVCKAHYFDGLLMLSSALYNEGRKKEAADFLRLAAAYNPAFNEFLEQCENDDSSPSDLTNRQQ